MRRLWLIALLLAGCRAGAPQPGVVRAAVAANLRDAFTEIAAAFARSRPGTRVDATFTSSGAATEQILQGAPFDIFFAADTKYPQRIEAAGKAVPGTRRVYARGRLALWISGRLPDLPSELSALRDPRVARVAIANPELAPYGRAAVEALHAAGLWDVVSPKLIFGQDVSQAAAQALAAGDAALLPLSLAAAPDLQAAGRTVALPAALHAPLDQASVVLVDRPEVRALAEYLAGPQARAILQAHGYEVP